MKEDLQFEKEYNATMEAFSKTVEENVESVANLVENNNNILGESNISVDNSDNNENKLVPLEQLTTVSLQPDVFVVIIGLPIDIASKIDLGVPSL